MTAECHRAYFEHIVAAALLKAFSNEVTQESRIMLGRYSRQIRFQRQVCRLIQTAFDMNISPESVDDPNTIGRTAELMGVDDTFIDELYRTPVVTEELYHAIVYLTGAVFDLGEIVERVALRDGD